MPYLRQNAGDKAFLWKTSPDNLIDKKSYRQICRWNLLSFCFTLCTSCQVVISYKFVYNEKRL